MLDGLDLAKLHDERAGNHAAAGLKSWVITSAALQGKPAARFRLSVVWHNSLDPQENVPCDVGYLRCGMMKKRVLVLAGGPVASRCRCAAGICHAGRQFDFEFETDGAKWLPEKRRIFRSYGRGEGESYLCGGSSAVAGRRKDGAFRDFVQQGGGLFRFTAARVTKIVRRCAA